MSEAKETKLAEIMVALTSEFIPNTPEFTTDEAMAFLETTMAKRPEVEELITILNNLKSSGTLGRVPLTRKWTRLLDIAPAAEIPPEFLHLVQMDIQYLDWQGNLPHMHKAYDSKEFALLIGPAGVGKTQCVRKLAELVRRPLFTVNMSLRTREHHLIGRPTTGEDGNIFFQKGPLPLSMECGGILYIDEGNTAEPSMWLRFDECLDSRRQLRIEDDVIVANPDWYVIMSVNPLGMGAAGGTRPLPPQVMNRFTVSFDFQFPDSVDMEYKVIRSIVPGVSASGIRQRVMWALEAIRFVRDSEELQYRPSIRESRTVARMLVDGEDLRTALQKAVVNRYAIYGPETKRKAAELVFSKLE